jgi:alkylation response protein AidB-like acyl-CoA dehydrogenase
MSDTERVALEAGTVWWDGELFRGNPDWNKLLAYPVPKLTAEEQSFMDNEVEQACALVDDWQVTSELNDLPPEAWQYIKDKGFLGMIIPKKYGGLEFSAYAHSQIVTKLSTRCSALSVSVMVPNSLGPAELLLHYGTEAQKNHYLPRLAKGIEIPAFALTSPWAGSDAGIDPGRRHRLQGHLARQGSAGHAGHLGQALHHARPGVHHPRPGFPPLRPGWPARRQEAYRHHLRAGTARHPGCRDRSPPLSA